MKQPISHAEQQERWLLNKFMGGKKAVRRMRKEGKIAPVPPSQPQKGEK